MVLLRSIDVIKMFVRNTSSSNLKTNKYTFRTELHFDPNDFLKPECYVLQGSLHRNPTNCRLQNPDKPQAGRVVAHGYAAGRVRARSCQLEGVADRTVRPGDNRPLYPPMDRNKFFERLSRSTNKRNPMQNDGGTKRAVDQRCIRMATAALPSWLLTFWAMVLLRSMDVIMCLRKVGQYKMLLVVLYSNYLLTSGEVVSNSFVNSAFQK